MATRNDRDSAAPIIAGPRYYSRVVDAWTLSPQWDRHGGSAAMILSTDRAELRPGEKRRIADGDHLLIWQQGMPAAFDTTCLGHAWAAEGGFITEDFIHGEKHRIAKWSELGSEASVASGGRTCPSSPRRCQSAFLKRYCPWT